MDGPNLWGIAMLMVIVGVACVQAARIMLIAWPRTSNRFFWSGIGISATGVTLYIVWFAYFAVPLL